MTTYGTKLTANRTLYVQNNGNQTIVALQSSDPGQQQSQSQAFKSGNWLVPPTLFQTSNGLVLRVEGEAGQKFVQLLSGGIQVMDSSPSLSGAQTLALQIVEESTSQPAIESMKPMEPMKPMKPMKPMEAMKPMKMEMGDMRLEMGGSSARESASAGQGARFCSQCGTPIKSADKFCSQCGHQVRS